MHIKHLTVTKVKKFVETFEWILSKYVMESESKSCQFIWLYESERNGVDAYKTFNCHQSEETC